MDNVTNEVTPTKFAIETKLSDISRRRSLRCQALGRSPVQNDSSLIASKSNSIETTPIRKKSSRPDRVELPLATSPSPYKPRRPKGLPKSAKGLQKKKELRNQALKDFTVLNEQLQNIVSSQADSIKSCKPSKRTKNDILGTLTPSTVVFSPSDYFVLFDENSLNPSDFVNEDSAFYGLSCGQAICHLKTFPILSLSAKECRLFSYLLCITTNCSVVNMISPLIFSKVRENSFYLGWSDVKQIVINFGLGLEYNKCSTDTSKRPPKKWNFEFFFSLLEHSHPHYGINCAKKLLFFLTDCLFEPLLFEMRASLIRFFLKMTKQLIENVSIATVLKLIDRYYLSITHNRYIFQCLALDSTLIQMANTLGECSIYTLLQLDYAGATSLNCLLNLMEDRVEQFEPIKIVSVYQVFLICEKMVLLCLVPVEKREMLEKLIRLAKKVCVKYGGYEYLYFSETISRLQEQATRLQP